MKKVALIFGITGQDEPPLNFYYQKITSFMGLKEKAAQLILPE